MKVIGIDPSLSATGLAYMDPDEGKVLAWRCVRTKPMDDATKTDDFVRRLTDLAFEVRRFCTEHKGAVAIEAQSGWGGDRGGMPQVFKLGAGYGAVLGSIPTRPIAIQPQMVKHRLGIEAKIDKKLLKGETWNAAKRFFTDFPSEPTNKVSREAVHDAVAVGVAALPELDRLKALMPE